MIEIKQISTFDECKKIEKLAEEIFPEVYKSIISESTILFLLHKYHSAEEAFKLSSKKNYQLYLLYYKSEAVGYLGIEILTDVVVIDKLYILEKFRGKKIGKHSIEFVFKQAEKFNILKIELTVHRDNENSIKVYTYFGFNIIMTLVHELKIGSTLYGFRMQKLL